MIDIKIKLIHPNAKIPTKGTGHSGAWDVYAAEIKRIRQDWYEVDLGFSLEFPSNYRLMLQPRSSITNSNLIQQNSPGLGDSDYRGIYKFVFKVLPIKGGWGIKYPMFPYQVGDRVGQIYLEEILPINFIQHDELTDSERGVGGFGSTGK